MHYLTAIQALIQIYRLEVQYASDQIDDGDSRISDITPLVVNTMGWTKGLGSDLNAKIEELVEPTDVFELGIPPESFPWTDAPMSGATWNDSERKLHTLSAITPSVLASRYTPADHRALSTISYFHAKELHSGTGNTVPRWETSLPLCAQPPYEVEVKIALDKVCLAMSGMEDIVPAEIQRVLNGAIVALVESEEDFPSAETPDLDFPYTQGSSLPSPYASNCVGLGLIRSMSPTHLHIITPIPPHMLARCRVLIKGEVELPIWGMLDFRSENGETVAGIERSKVPYLRWGKGEGLGAEKRRVRRNLMRRGQL